MSTLHKIEKFINRLQKIGVDIELSSNVPWIYLYTVNGKRVKGNYMGEHGYTAFFLPVRLGANTKPTDIKKIFSKIRETIEQAD